MKEVTNTTSVTLEVINPTTGEIFDVKGRNSETIRYYSISKVTSRVNVVQLLNSMEKICKSPKDIRLLNCLLDKINTDGFIVISNMAGFAKELEVSRSKLNELFKRGEETGFFKKEGTGVYRVNPFVFIGKRTRSNADRERLQIEWGRNC